MASTSGALPARNRPVKVSRSDGSPGSGSAGSPSRQYRGAEASVGSGHLPKGRKAGTAFGGRARDVQPPPPVLPAGASPGSTVLPGTTRLPAAA